MKKLLIIFYLLTLSFHQRTTDCIIISEVSKLSPTRIDKLVKPNSIDELQSIVRSTHTPIAIAGGKFSQGGQIAYPDGLVIDMTNLNRIINFDPANKRITVQTGIRWKDIQQVIDPYDLSIDVMQSYNDFTVGGSLSVNAHGRTLHGQLINTVESIKVLLADGSLVEANRNINTDLFNAAIGGYGLMGIITEATLVITHNEKIERKVQTISVKDYPNFFFTHIHNNSDVIFHNANLYPPDFNTVLSITWYKTNKMLTNTQRLQKQGLYLTEKLMEQLLRRISFFKQMRQRIEPKQLSKEAVVWRNYEMSYSVKSLEPLIRFPTTSILQEYFVPIAQLNNFVNTFRTIVDDHKINIINVSIRYIPKNTEALLTYASQDSFALVCYINVLRTKEQTRERIWTQTLIDNVLACGGTYYLPYHLYATCDQFKKAYPHYEQFIEVKKKYDPNNRFMNSLYKCYIAPL